MLGIVAADGGGGVEEGEATFFLVCGLVGTAPVKARGLFGWFNV